MERLTERLDEGIRVATADGQLKEESEILWDAIEKLADYEDAEEQGRLIKLPCTFDDKVYWITSTCNDSFEKCPYPFRACSCCEEAKHSILEAGFGFEFLKNGTSELEENVFLTREEAEAKLAKMGV